MGEKIWRQHFTFTTDNNEAYLNCRNAHVDTFQVEVIVTGTPGANDRLQIETVDPHLTTPTNPVPVRDRWGNTSPFSLQNNRLFIIEGRYSMLKFLYDEAGGGSTDIRVRVRAYDGTDAHQFQAHDAWMTATAGAAADGPIVKLVCDGD